MYDILPYDCLTSSNKIKQWYENNYHLLSLSGLWLKGGEPNTMDPAAFNQAEVRFLICRLSTYRDVSPSISHSLVAQIAGEVDGVFTDFAFLPPPKDVEVMTASQIPLWIGTATKAPPCAFDVLGISNSFILELLNLPKLLHFSGIPLCKNERMARRDVPLVILGGASAAVTSVLHGHGKNREFGHDCPAEAGDKPPRYGNEYGLVDAVLIGEGELSVKQFLEVVKKGKASGLTKREILRACHGKVDGFYEPDKYEHQYKGVSRHQSASLNSLESTEKKGACGDPQFPPGKEEGLPGDTNGNYGDEILAKIVPTEPYVSFPVKSAVVYDLDQVRTMESAPVWYEPETLGTGSLQISNGCSCFCSFCAESWERKPYRERSLPKLLEGLKAAKAHQGLDAINLLSFNFNTHAELYPMILSFYKEMANISLKSQRFDLLSTDRFLAEVQQLIGKTTVSCGMEGISERLRRYLHKNLTEEQIYKACEFLFERGIRELKVFLISTGLEQAEDIGEFEGFVKSLESLQNMSDSKARIVFSLTPLYYPPHTPLQFNACTTAIEDNKKTRRELERICKSNGMEFRESASHEEMWMMQLLAMGDRRLTPALIRSSVTDGFLYYNTIPKQVARNWRAYLTELGLSETYYFREKGEGDVFPWDDIDMGVPRKFLWEEYKRAAGFTEREYCLGRPGIEAQCLGCGACPSGAHIKKITGHTMSQPFLLEELQRVAHTKRNLLTLRAEVEIEPAMRLAPKQFIGVAIARAIMLAMPEITPYYHSLSGHIRNFETDKPPSDFTYGVNVYYLSFLTDTIVKESPFSQRLCDVQKHSRGFKLREISLDSRDVPDIKYILFRLDFPADFTASSIQQKLGEYLHARYVKHTLLKKDGCAMFKVDPKNKKNAVVLYARIDKAHKASASDTDYSVLMAVTRQFDMQSFLDAFYGFERRREVVRTMIETLGYYGKNPLPKDTRCISCGDYVHETPLFGLPLKERQCLVCSL